MGGGRTAANGDSGTRPGRSGHGSGSGAGGGPVLDTSATTPQVDVKLDASQQRGVKVGDRAQVTLPNGQNTPGIVSSIGAASGSSNATIPVEISLPHPQAARGLDQAPVQVQITGATVKSALIAPIDALLSLAGGHYAVETVRPDGSHHLVPVTVGQVNAADGLAQVRGARLRAGTQVVAPST